MGSAGERWCLTDLDDASVLLRKQISRVRGEVDQEAVKRRGRLAGREEP